MDTNSPTLFNMTPRCFSCGDLGLVYTDGIARQCWRIPTGTPHNAPNAAAEMIAHSLRQLQIEKVAIDLHTFEVARSLAEHTSAKPGKRDDLIKRHFDFSPSALRKLHLTIETLRKFWLLPVGSRKGKHDDDPAGYWIITTAEDFAEWVRHANAAPITQLTTNYRVAKRNFPIFAEQMELEFFNDIAGPDDARDVAAAA